MARDKDKPNCWRLWYLIVFANIVLVAGAIFGGIAVRELDGYDARQPSARATRRQRFLRVRNEFARTNPVSLVGWTHARETNRDTWTRGRVTYTDWNRDGLPDMKHLTGLGTDTIEWVDSDHDGMFDTLREHGCFHNESRPLRATVPVPKP